MTHDALLRPAGSTAASVRADKAARTWARRIDCSPDDAPAPRESAARGSGERLEPAAARGDEAPRRAS